jgi:hypothetical protein
VSDVILYHGYCPLCDVLFDASTRTLTRQHAQRHWRWHLRLALWWYRRWDLTHGRR